MMSVAHVTVTLLCLQVKAALVWNVISVVIGLAGVAYLCWLLAVDLPAAQFCVTDAAGQSWSTEEEQKCVMKMRLLNVSQHVHMSTCPLGGAVLCVTVRGCCFRWR